MAARKNMIDEEIIARMREYMPNYLTMKGIDYTRAFRCLSPDHLDSKPSMSYIGIYKGKPLYIIRCFSCGRKYDIFDLVGQDYGLMNWIDQARKVADIFDVKLNIEKGKIVGGEVPAATHAAPAAPVYKTYDISQRINDAANNVGYTDYFKSRGFSARIINEKKLGYWAAGYNDFVQPIDEVLTYKVLQQKHYTYIVPLLDFENKPLNFIARMNDNGVVDEYNPKTLNMRGVEMPFVNGAYLSHPELMKGAKVLFIVEGWADAYSIEEAGGRAIALNSTSNVERFLMLCAANLNHLKDINIVTAGDRDPAGKKMNESLANGIPKNKVLGLNQLGIKNMPFNVAGYYKDANEFLIADRDSFISTIKGVIENRLGRFRVNKHSQDIER